MLALFVARLDWDKNANENYIGGSEVSGIEGGSRGSSSVCPSNESSLFSSTNQLGYPEEKYQFIVTTFFQQLKGKQIKSVCSEQIRLIEYETHIQSIYIKKPADGRFPFDPEHQQESPESACDNSALESRRRSVASIRVSYEQESSEPSCGDVEQTNSLLKHLSEEQKMPQLRPEVVPFEALMLSIEKEGRLLGSGSYGKVYLAFLKLHGKEQAVAAKKFKPFKDDKPQSKRQFSSEMKVLAKCQHPNIVSLLGYSVDGPELLLVYELIAGGTLKDALSKKNLTPLGFKERLCIARDVSGALNYLHARTIVHRDVKTSNLLLTEEKMVKLADFGLSTVCPNDLSWDSSRSAGTRCYMSPEAFEGRITKKLDVYAYAMVLYEIATGLPPYSHSKKTDLITYMKDLEEEGEKLTVMVDPRAQWPDEVACNLFEISKRCSSFEKEKRPSMDEVFNEIQSMIFGYLLATNSKDLFTCKI